jgi:hypothetical protein
LVGSAAVLQQVRHRGWPAAAQIDTNLPLLTRTYSTSYREKTEERGYNAAVDLKHRFNIVAPTPRVLSYFRQRGSAYVSLSSVTNGSATNI